jgi:hypothetical protein
MRASVSLALLFVCLPAMVCAQNDRYGVITQELTSAEVDAVARIGAGWVMLDFGWARVDRDCGSAADLPSCRDYASLVAMVALANARGLRVLADMGSTAAWASSTGQPQAPPTNLQDYADYVADIVARFTPLGVHHWKIWNEPNLSNFLTSATTWQAQYRTYVETARAAIKRVDPAAVVVGPDVSFHALAGGSVSEFAQVMADFGSDFDIVSIHHYDTDGVPLGVRLDEDVAPFRAGKPVWVTETGQKWTTEGETPALQQQYYLRALSAYEARASWVRNIFFYQLVGADLFNISSDGSFTGGLPALQSYADWVRLGPTAAMARAPITTASIDAGSLDASKWIVGLATGSRDATVPLHQFGTQIHIGPLSTGTSGSHYNGVEKPRAIDLTGGLAGIKLLAPPSADTAAFAMLTLVADASNQYRIYVQGGRISLEQKIDGVTTTLGSLAFSPTQTPFLAIAHQVATDEIVFGTASSDGHITPRVAVPRNMQISSMTFELKAGTSSAEWSSPGTVVFDQPPKWGATPAPTRYGARSTEVR